MANAKDILMQGEEPIEGAPVVKLPSGQACIPQHYLRFKHSLASVSELLKHIDFSKNFKLYASEDGPCLYIQVEICGYENYDRSNQVREPKKVYGRIWRVEKNLPTSEIIQTVFLAIKTAREHEIRELFTLKHASTGKESTVFSNHIDLPLACREFDYLVAKNTPVEPIHNIVKQVRFNGQSIVLKQTTQVGDVHVLNLQLQGLSLAKKQEGQFLEYDHLTINLLLHTFSNKHFLYALMDKLIEISNAYVEEHFTYKGKARFSRKIDPAKLSEMSLTTRNPSLLHQDKNLKQQFKKMNSEVDSTRLPQIFKVQARH